GALQLLLPQAIERLILPPEIVEIGLDRQRPAGDALHELVGSELGAMLVNALLQPTMQDAELASLHVVRNRRVGACRRIHEERAAQAVAGRGALDGAAGRPGVPVAARQPAALVVGHRQSEIALEALAPHAR